MLNEEEEADADDDGDGDDDNSNGDAALARKIQNEDDNDRASQRSSKRLASTYDQIADIQASAAEREKRQVQLMNRRNEERVYQGFQRSILTEYLV